MSDLPWHAVTVYSGFEDQFERTVADLETFCPRTIQRERRYNRIVEKPRPLVAGYIFVRFDGRDAYEWNRVRYAGGVREIMGGEYPTPVRAEDLAPWMAALGPDGLIPSPEVEKYPYRAGDCLIVIGGPFSENPAKCSWVDARGARVIGRWFNRDVEMFLPHALLRKATRAEAEDAGMLRQSQRLSMRNTLKSNKKIRELYTCVT